VGVAIRADDGRWSEFDRTVKDGDVTAPERFAHFAQRQLLAGCPNVDERLPLRECLLEVSLEPPDLLGEILEPLAGFWAFGVNRDLDAFVIELGSHSGYHSQRRARLRDHRLEMPLFVHDFLLLFRQYSASLEESKQGF
jgi:hypothetical protein